VGNTVAMLAERENRGNTADRGSLESSARG